eukprot:29896-Amphidinium_carterae.1
MNLVLFFVSELCSDEARRTVLVSTIKLSSERLAVSIPILIAASVGSSRLPWEVENLWTYGPSAGNPKQRGQRTPEP